jgi:hypothetical protein
MDWRLQVLKKMLLIRLPFSIQLRRLKRQLLGCKPDSQNISNTVQNFLQMRAELYRSGHSFFDSKVLEIGTGWFPTIPLLLSQDEVKQVYMSDLIPHMDEVTFNETLQLLKQIHGFDKDNKIKTIDDIPAVYIAPFDSEKLPVNSIDYVISRTVLEHISPEKIVSLFVSLRPKMSKNGLMVHLVDHSDHLEFNDKKISRINFLTWSKRKHDWINYLMRDGENRLRHHEYPALFKRAGFRVLSEQAFVHEPSCKIAKTLQLAEPYAAMTPEQLAVLTSIFILAPEVTPVITDCVEPAIPPA